MNNNEKNKEYVCSRCGRIFTGNSAVSREDNKSVVCHDCSVAEAFEELAFNNFCSNQSN